MLFVFELKKKTSEAEDMISQTLKKDAVFISTVKIWFQWFRKSNLNLNEDERTMLMKEQPKNLSRF